MFPPDHGSAALSVCSLAVLAANAHYAWTTMHTELEVDLIPVWPQSEPDPFCAFNLAVAVMSLITLLVMSVSYYLSCKIDEIYTTVAQDNR